MTNEESAITYLKGISQTLKDEKLWKLCNIVTTDQDFLDGFGAKSHHHNYPGGLPIHTAEVLKNCLSVDLAYVKRDVLIVAAIWHDYMKKKDYTVEAGKGVTYTSYKNKIYHISGSYAEFYHQAKTIGIDEQFIEDVGHCLLSHHGRPEWGSPITPQTPEAVILHWADCMSAWFENGKYKEKT